MSNTVLTTVWVGVEFDYADEDCVSTVRSCWKWVPDRLPIDTTIIQWSKDTTLDPLVYIHRVGLDVRKRELKFIPHSTGRPSICEKNADLNDQRDLIVQ